MRSRRSAGNRQGGFTLVQLMVGLVVSLVILSGVVYVFVGTSRTGQFQLRSTRFVQDMREGMGRMVRDVRRAGYYLNTASVTLNNPFSADSVGGITTDITVGEAAGEAANSCILYAYNLDDDNPPLVDSGTTTVLAVGFDNDKTENELFGFRLSNGELEMRTGMGGSTSFDCDNGSWQSITDPNLTTITGLSFSVASNQCSNLTESGRSDCYGVTPGTTTDDPQSGDVLLEVREVTVTLTGQSVDDPDLTHTLTQRISIPNDRIWEEP